MPRRSIFTDSERDNLLALPEDHDSLIRFYTFNESDLAIIQQHRGASNRLGFAIQLCFMRYPGMALPVEGEPSIALLQFVSQQLKIDTKEWSKYSQRDVTRREHLLELQSVYGYKAFSLEFSQMASEMLEGLAWQTDKGIVLAEALIQYLRNQSILLPSINVIERICAEAITKSTRRIHAALTDQLTKEQLLGLDTLLSLKPESNMTLLSWLRQPTGSAKARHILEHIDRLQTIREFGLPDGLEKAIHQNRLLKIAREGRQMTPQDLGKFEQNRRYATLTALVLELQATITDEIIDLNDRIIGSLFNKAKRSHEQQFQQSGKEINDKVRLLCKVGQALIQAKRDGTDPFAAIEEIIPWEKFAKSITDAQSLSQPEDFDYLYLIGDNYSQVRRYAPVFLEKLVLHATPSTREILEAIEMLKRLNNTKLRKIPDDAPTDFIRKRWKPLVFTPEGISRRYYELCLLAELKNSLRSGDIWVKGSRQFKDFNEYLLLTPKYLELKESGRLALAVSSDCEQYLDGRLRQKKLYDNVATRPGVAALNEMSWADFERLVSEYYRRNGFQVTREGGNGPDGGIDLVLRQRSATYLVQCKQWKAYKVGVQPVREFYGVMSARGVAGGYFVTSGEYTGEAKAFAKGLNIILIDGRKLREMIDVASKTIAVSATSPVPTPIPTPAPSQPVATLPVCPKCSSEMKKRVARQGANTGKEFWGCVSYSRVDITYWHMWLQRIQGIIS